MVPEYSQQGKAIMTINEKIEELEVKYKECQQDVINADKKYLRFRRIPSLRKHYLKQTILNTEQMHMMFKELREVMQKEYPERFIGVSK